MPMLPEFNLPKRDSKPRSPQQVFPAKRTSIKKKLIKQIGIRFEPYISNLKHWEFSVFRVGGFGSREHQLDDL